MPPKRKTSQNQAAPTPVLSLRLSPKVIERLDALVSSPNAAEIFPTDRPSGRIDRSLVLREAVARGLERLESLDAKAREAKGGRRS